MLNSIAVVRHWDPYPFILLNLAFSTQAAYAAPLILLAQTRQAERDAAQAEQLEGDREQELRESLRREAAIERLAAELRAFARRQHAPDARDPRRRRAVAPAEPAAAARPARRHADPNLYPSTMLRSIGILLVCLGSVVLATDGSRWDFEVLSFPGPGLHGLHAFELVGFGVVAAGVVALWAARAHRRRT